ncbi:hypothetical protein OAC63_00710 [Amylibacter sp.]|jgi:hypothetical protein|nr:hypothetical protein [Paracoccaceae bacterium]MDB9856897.1 hypothetical protein [Amylibacter sp.]
MIHQRIDPFTIRQIRELLRPDLQSATSRTDLKARLKAKGYGLRNSIHGTVLTAEPHGVPLFAFSALHG